MYACAPLAVASAVVELPYLAAQALVFFPISYFMIGFQATADGIFIYAIIFLQSIALYTYMGQLFAYLLPTPVLALVCGGLLHLLWQMFNGFLLPEPQMAAGWVWLNYIAGTKWVVYGIGASQLSNVDSKMVFAGARTRGVPRQLTLPPPPPPSAPSPGALAHRTHEFCMSRQATTAPDRAPDAAHFCV